MYTQDQGCINPVRQITVVTVLYDGTYYLWNLLHVTLRETRVVGRLRFLENFCTLAPDTIKVGYIVLKMRMNGWTDIYRVIHKSLRNFRTRLRNNQDRHGRKEHINK